MEGTVKKYQQKYKRAREQMDRWDELQSRFLSLFRNASAIILRFQVIEDSKNHGVLNSVGAIGEALMQSQIETLRSIFLSINTTMEEFCSVVSSLDKLQRDGRQLVKGGPNQPSLKHLHQRVGIKPTLIDCVDGLSLLYDMYHSEYLLKTSIVSAVSAIALKQSSTEDIGTLQRLLVDQPNIPEEEVRFILDIIFAEELS